MKARQNERIREHKEINKENEALVRRLYDKKSELSKKKMLLEYKQSRNYSSLRTCFKPDMGISPLPLHAGGRKSKRNNGLKLPSIDKKHSKSFNHMPNAKALESSTEEQSHRSKLKSPTPELEEV